MPEQRTIQRARKKARAGRAPSTQAGEFVREEIHHIRGGKHGAKNAKQAIAIGLSKARKAGVELPPRGAKGRKRKTRRHQIGPSLRRSRAISRVLEREPRAAGSRRALEMQTHRAARKRGASARSRAARKAVATKGPRLLKAEARKAARTRKSR